MNKLIVVIMGQDVENFIGMALESSQKADAIVYLDGGSKDTTLEIVRNFKDNSKNNFTILKNNYDKKNPQMNGIQRNIYLNYLKETYPEDWCLVIDADEIIDNLNQVKKFINEFPPGIYSVKMRHLIRDLAHEDATQPEHFVPNRLFKISEAKEYPLVEHPVLIGKENTQISATKCTTIWHLAYIPNMWGLLTRYENHLLKSNIHTPEFLKGWYYSHLFGKYPVKELNLEELPELLLNKFGIDKDEIYFAKRGLELKHFIDAIHWKEFFGKGKTIDFLEFGCGRGPRVYALEKLGCTVNGIELSKYAVDNSFSSYVSQGDVLTSNIDTARTVIAYDLLEHIDYKDIDKAIDNLIKHSQKYILVSVPVIGDPNLELDPTHKIKETKEWWKLKFETKGCKSIDIPKHFLFRHQLLIFEVLNG